MKRNGEIDLPFKKKMIDWAVTQRFIVGRAPIYANVLHES